MRSWYAIADMIGLFALMIIMVTVFHRINIYEQEYNENRLGKATEYSTQAAFSLSLHNKSVSDYKETDLVDVDNRKTLETFEDMMCFNYNLTRTDRSRAAIDDSIRSGVLVTKEGFYVLKLQTAGYRDSKGNDQEKRLMWTPKLPFSGTRNKKTIGYELFGKACRSVSEDGSYERIDNAVTGLRFDDFDDYDAARRQAISESITNALTYTSDYNDSVRGEAEFGTYVPSRQTISGINSIKTPTLMFIIQGGGYTGEVAHENVALTGYRVIKKPLIVKYLDTKDGKRKYSYEFQGALDEKNTAGGQVNIKEGNYVYDPRDAARDGYAPDYDYIFNPIDYNTYYDKEDVS